MSEILTSLSTAGATDSTFRKVVADVSLGVTTEKNGNVALDKKKVFAADNKDTLTTMRTFLLGDIKNAVQGYKSLVNGESPHPITGQREPILNLSFSDYVTERYGISKFSDNTKLFHDGYLNLLGFNDNSPLTSLMDGGTAPNTEWLIPILFEEIIRTGIEDASGHYKNWISGSRPISSMNAMIPYIMQPNLQLTILGEKQTAKTANIEFDEKPLHVKTVGTAFQISDLLRWRVPLPLLEEVMRWVPTYYNRVKATQVVDTLLNGDLPSWAAPVVGADTANSLTYGDLAKAFIALQNINYSPSIMLTNYDNAINVGLMPEFTGLNDFTGFKQIEIAHKRLQFPSRANLDYHGSFPSGLKQLMIDVARGVTEFVYKPMWVERDRNIKHGMDTFYVKEMYGFGLMHPDSRLLLDCTVNKTTSPLPAAFDYPSYEEAPLIN